MARNGDLKSPVALPRASWGDTLKRTARKAKDDKINHCCLLYTSDAADE